jgi:hypothetical protein
MRIISVSHLPESANSGPSLLMKSSSRSLLSTKSLSRSGSSSMVEEGRDSGSTSKASVEIDLFGSPCDRKHWNTMEVANDGSKYIFDQVPVPYMCQFFFSINKPYLQKQHNMHICSRRQSLLTLQSQGYV